MEPLKVGYLTRRTPWDVIERCLRQVQHGHPSSQCRETMDDRSWVAFVPLMSLRPIKWVPIYDTFDFRCVHGVYACIIIRTLVVIVARLRVI